MSSDEPLHADLEAAEKKATRHAYQVRDSHPREGEMLMTLAVVVAIFALAREVREGFAGTSRHLSDIEDEQRRMRQQ